MPVKLIAMDIDGTLLDSRGQLPEENALAIGEAAARGIEIVIVTGRRFHPARSIAEQLPCDVALIVSNGALVKSRSGETHLRSLLPIETARHVIDATGEFRRCQGVIFDRPAERQVIFERIDWEGPFIGPYLRRHRHQVAEVAPLAACLEMEDPVEIMFIGECEMIRGALRTLETHARSREYTLALTEYEERGMSMLDVLQRGVTKGAALAEWARRRGIVRESVMAIGDNWNDREMLEYAGVPVVMGNSVPELKTLGWKVTLSNDDCGVADAIRTYALDPNGRD
jgi:5-amino-6-(5-phospho-D-ribitylamino)uracil phosphatase